MKLVCSYCRKVIREVPGGRVTDVSHGMCPECAAHFDRLWSGMPLAEYLDGLPQPVLVVTEEGRIVALNAKAAALTGRTPAELRGLLGGEAFACVRSRLPEGCGKTVHCRECTVRRTLNAVARTGRAAEHVPAYVDTKAGRLDVRIGVRKLGEVFHVTIEEVSAARATA
jgi:PAS domain-containing protein